MPFQKTPEEIIATIKMLKASGVDIFILVEGNFDYIFWKNKKAPRSTIDVINCQGRNNVEKITDSGLLNNSVLIIGITDKDYDHFFSSIARNNNLIYTDYNDLETTILSFDISKDIIQKVCDLDKIRNDSICLDNPEEIFRESLLIGKLRYISKKNNICFPFENRYPLGKYYNNHVFNSDSLLHDFSKYAHINIQTLQEEVDKVSYDIIWNILRGHDCILNLRQFIQYYKLPSIKANSIEEYILCSFTNDMFMQTKLYKQIKNMEKLINRPIIC